MTFRTCRPRARPRCALRIAAQPFLPSVITETGLDIHRYICNALFGSRAARCQLRSSTEAVGAFALTDSIPFSMAAVDEYIWLHPTVSPFAALRMK